MFHLIPQGRFPPPRTSNPAVPVPSAQVASPWSPTARPFRTRSASVTVATSSWVPFPCVHLAPSAPAARASSVSAAFKETLCVRPVAPGHILRNASAPNPVRPAPSAPTLKWRSGPVCPTLTPSAWVSYSVMNWSEGKWTVSAKMWVFCDLLCCAVTLIKPQSKNIPSTENHTEISWEDSLHKSLVSWFIIKLKKTTT